MWCSRSLITDLIATVLFCSSSSSSVDDCQCCDLLCALQPIQPRILWQTLDPAHATRRQSSASSNKLLDTGFYFRVCLVSVTTVTSSHEALAVSHRGSVPLLTVLFIVPAGSLLQPRSLSLIHFVRNDWHHLIWLPASQSAAPLAHRTSPHENCRQIRILWWGRTIGKAFRCYYTVINMIHLVGRMLFNKERWAALIIRGSQG